MTIAQTEARVYTTVHIDGDGGEIGVREVRSYGGTTPLLLEIEVNGTFQVWLSLAAAEALYERLGAGLALVRPGNPIIMPSYHSVTCICSACEQQDHAADLQMAEASDAR